jgi:hypothetical protein
MGRSITMNGQGSPISLAGVSGTGIPDLPLLLAVHAARQAAEPTARIVRTHDLPVAGDDAPGRLTLIFAPTRAKTAVLLKVAGSFNALVAAHMTTGTDDEDEVHLGS